MTPESEASGMFSSSDDRRSVRMAVDRLSDIQHLLRITGLMAVGATGGQLVVVLLTAFLFAGVFSQATAATSCILLAAVVIAAVVFHENLRKKGDALFEEISDEFQRRSRNESIGEPLPYLEARIALRSFSSTSDLPLVPGKFGPGVYALLNVAFVVLEFFVVSFWRLQKF